MADQVTNYQCPACTGPLHFDGKIGKLKCDYCGSTYTVEEVEKLFAAKNESAVQAKEKEDRKAEAAASTAAAASRSSAARPSSWKTATSRSTPAPAPAAASATRSVRRTA